MADPFDEGTTGLRGMLSRGTHAFMYTGHYLWKNSGLKSPLCDSMLTQSSKHATQPMSREEIREVIHKAKAKMNIGAAEDLIFDRSGGMWDSRTGEFIGKMWEAL